MNRTRKKIIKITTVCFLCMAMVLATVNMSAFRMNVMADEQLSTIQKMQRQLQQRGNNTLLEGVMPCRGNVKLLVINLVSSGEPNEYSRDDLQELLFGEHHSFDSPVRDQNLTDYFESVSYGKLSVDGKVVDYTIDDDFETNGWIYNNVEQIVGDVLCEENGSDYDSNNDGYIDGVAIFLPDKYSTAHPYDTAWVSSCDCTFDGLSLASYMTVTKWYKTVSTIAHEIVHLMGTPDMYANVSVNKAGCFADALMAGGLTSRGDAESGIIIANMPGILKLLFGWMDDIQEISVTDEYTLNSFSKGSNCMVIYPEGDKTSKFIFFVEYLTPDNQDIILDICPYFGQGGIRIWKILLNVDDDGNIVGNSGQKGDGNSPFQYIEAVNDGSQLLFQEGEEWSGTTSPNSDYFKEVTLGSYSDEKGNYTDYAALPVEEFASGITLDSIRLNSDYAKFNITISTDCDHTFDDASWIYDAESHYHLCSVCQEKDTAESHTFIWVTDKEASETETGLKHEACTVCGYLRNENTVTDKLTSTHTYTYETITKKATIARDGSITTKCTGCGMVTATTVIPRPSAVILEKNVFTYTGKKLKPGITVTDSSGAVIPPTSYTVNYVGNKAVGTAVAQVTFNGNYSGRMQAAFTINPKGATLKKVTAKTKGFTVKWKIQKLQTTGYEIQYSTSKKFTKKTTFSKTVKKASKQKLTVNKLKAKKNYYVRIRTYKTVNGKKYYSSWSGTKKIRTRK